MKNLKQLKEILEEQKTQPFKLADFLFLDYFEDTMMTDDEEVHDSTYRYEIYLACLLYLHRVLLMEEDYATLAQLKKAQKFQQTLMKKTIVEPSNEETIHWWFKLSNEYYNDTIQTQLNNEG